MVEVDTVKSPLEVSTLRQKLVELFHSSFWTLYKPPSAETTPYVAQDWVAACAVTAQRETARRAIKMGTQELVRIVRVVTRGSSRKYRDGPRPIIKLFAWLYYTAACNRLRR